MLAEGMPPDFLPSHERAYAALEDMDKLVIAVLHGHALGAGLLAALACDLRICSTDAVLGLLAARYGLFPAMGTFRLPRLIGLGPARRLILSGETVDPAEAHRLGWSTTWSPRERFADGVAELVARYAALSPAAVVAIKRLTGRAFDAPARHRPRRGRCRCWRPASRLPTSRRERRVAGPPVQPRLADRRHWLCPDRPLPVQRPTRASAASESAACRSPAYATASTSACQDASTTLACTPTVVHGRAPSVDSTSTRVTASVPCVSDPAGQDAHLVVGQLDVLELRAATASAPRAARRPGR